MAEMINDSLKSFTAGLGDPMRDKRASAHYAASFLGDYELISAYRSSWLSRKIVDIPAKDSVRNGRNWQAEQDQIELIEAEETRLGLWQKLQEVQEKARLFGGAAIYIGNGDSDPSEPLDYNRVSRAGLRYLTVLSRREVIAGELDQDATSQTYGKPKHYEVTAGGAFTRIHPSRLAVFTGDAQPDIWTAAGPNYGWGDSVLQSVYDAVKNADGAAANISSLLFEANVDVFRIPGMMANMSDPEYSRRLLDRFSLAAMAKGINRSLILDKEEEYERKQVAFSTLPEIMSSFLQQVAGAADVPVTRLLGQSPAGMNATGISDMKNYHDKIHAMQRLSITPAINILDECLIRSALGNRPPEVYYTWAPLEQMSEKEKAEIGKLNADTAAIYANIGAFTPDEMRQAVKNKIIETDYYPGFDQITDGTDSASFDLGENNDDEVQPV